MTLLEVASWQLVECFCSVSTAWVIRVNIPTSYFGTKIAAKIVPRAEIN